jgi:Calcineurin-like phosphoesterase
MQRNGVYVTSVVESRMALFAVGDIHGNIRALDSLLESITPEISDSGTLAFLGDYIDRGPHVRECVDRIIALKRLESTAEKRSTSGQPLGFT